MLDFAERLQKEIRILKRDAENHLLSGRISSMEQYKLLMGRLEGYAFVEEVLKQLLDRNSED